MAVSDVIQRGPLHDVSVEAMRAVRRMVLEPIITAHQVTKDAAASLAKVIATASSHSGSDMSAKEAPTIWGVQVDAFRKAFAPAPSFCEDEVREWVKLHGATQEWLAAHPGAALPLNEVALVTRGGTPIRFEGIPGAPNASPEGLTWGPA
jgi:hypothetical protein